MSKVTYLWGAGASFGRRPKAEVKAVRYIERGVPIISEFSKAIDDLLRLISSQEGGNFRPVNFKYAKLESYLKALQQICQEYPTIDTYAKQIFVTHEINQYPPIYDYEDLKFALTLFLCMIQSVKTRDSRYDGFIASVINEKGVMPPMTILSWNYDVQFEMAYSGYALALTDGRYLYYQWDQLNVRNKTYTSPFHDDNPFCIIKLNGTATFTTDEYQVLNNHNVKKIIDPYFGRRNDFTPLDFGNEVLQNRYHTNLSYVWEEDSRGVIDTAKTRVADTEDLIVIGYSFPYVNRKVDGEILQSMPTLKRIYIQDLAPREIEERIKSMLPDALQESVSFTHINNLSQFYLPNSF